MTDLVARRVAPGIPIWDILANGEDIGCATVLPMEGCAKATVRYGMDVYSTEFAAPTLRQVLAKVRAFIDREDADMKAEADAEYHAEVIAPMQYAERMAERGWFANGYDHLD